MSTRGHLTRFVFILGITFLANLRAYSATKNYISYDLEYQKFEVLRLKLEKTLPFKIKNRGEAHITVVTPPEFEKLKTKLSPEKMHALADEVLSKKPSYEIICQGMGSALLKGQLEKTFYVVVKAPALLKIREKLSRLSGLSNDLFNPKLFFPHVTLGFTSRDLYYEDGVIKDRTSCSKK